MGIFVTPETAGSPGGALGEPWGALEELWEALGELWEGLEELWEALYIDKLPINRPSGRYVTSKNMTNQKTNRNATIGF